MKPSAAIASIVVTLATFVLQAPTAAAQLSGAVNRYARVVDVDHCRSELVVDPPGLFAAGDRILIHQAYGGTVDTTNTLSHGLPTSSAGAGTMEVATVASVTGNRVRLATMLVERYDVASAVQAVRIAVHTKATTTGIVTAAPWNGSTGGIVAIECSDTLFMRHTIEVRGKGFRGGDASVNVADTMVTDWTMTDNDGRSGRKGEGFVRPNRLHGAGRGPWSSGGGGGNARNGGGGGGGNRGRGGTGGGQTSEYADADVGGRGGHGATVATTIEATFGGGGGGGQQNDFNGGRGGNGGGLVVLRAAALVAAPGTTIDVRGATGGSARQDGAGGGGAGGSVVLDVAAPLTGTTVDIGGGAGGDADGSTACYAPGGGGGGGRLYRTTRTSGVPIMVATGGPAGSSTLPPALCPQSPSIVATAGAAGGTAAVVDIAEGTAPNPPAPRLARGRDTICPGETVTLAVLDAQSVTWLEAALVADPAAATTATVALTADTVLHVVMVMPVTLCPIVDSVVVRVHRPTNDSVLGPLLVCTGSPERYTIVAAGSRARTWTAPTGSVGGANQDSTVAVLWTTPGRHVLRCDYVDSNGCSRTIVSTVDVQDTLRPVIGGRRTFCDGDSTVLDAGPGYTSYMWSTGETTPTIVVRTPGTVSVAVTASGSCRGSSETITVERIPLPTPRLVATRTELTSDTDSVEIVVDGGPYTRVLWSNGATADTLRVGRVGAYSAVVWTPDGCPGTTDTIVITRRNTARPVELSVADVRYRAGDGVGITVAVVPPGIDTASTVIDFTVRTRATMLVPAGDVLQAGGALRATLRRRRIDPVSGNVEVDVRLDIPAGQAGSATVVIPFTGVLGDSAHCAIVIDTCQVAGGSTTCMVTRNGTATNDDLCVDRGDQARLFAADTAVSVALAGSSITVTAACSVSVDCFDALGRRQDDMHITERSGLSTTYTLASGGQRFLWWQVRGCGRVVMVPVVVAGH